MTVHKTAAMPFKNRRRHTQVRLPTGMDGMVTQYGHVIPLLEVTLLLAQESRIYASGLRASSEHEQ
jgi:hypothetical protein